jgi:proteasome accessory factor C
VTDQPRRARVTAGDRVRRLLAIVPWIAARDGPTIEEICRRFGLTRSELLADLDVVFMVGLYPFTPDELIDVIIEDDRVFIRLADYFTRPLRLTPEQALALVAAGASLAPWGEPDPDGPLSRGLAKVAAVLGIDQESALQVRLGEARPELLDELRGAVAEGRQVELRYYSYGRDEQTSRVVDPHRVYADSGQWYLDAHCHTAAGRRLFRLDRIETAVVTDRPIAVPPPDGPTSDGAGDRGVGVFHPRAEDPRVVLELDPSAAWLVGHYPCERVEDVGGGRLRVTLAISAAAWLERLLVRLGPAAKVVSADPPLGPDVGRRAAERILRRYRGAPPPG